MERANLKRWLLGRDDLPAQQRGEFVFFQNPQATDAERAGCEPLLAEANRVDASEGWLCIPTGGSSGKVRFARHDEKTLHASVSGFCLHFGVTKVNALGVLPLYHVSGLMALLRCLSTGGQYLDWDWKALSTGQWPTLPETIDGWFLSLVPTQLQRLLEIPSGTEFLRRFRLIFIGGGPAWPQLLEAAALAKLPLSFSYGMTETAAMIAAQTPTSFLRGQRDSGRPMPHAEIAILSDDGQSILPGQTGQIQITGPSVFKGYFPEFRIDRSFAPEDLGAWTEQGTLKILGRRDDIIITGGEKVWPAEVEGALRDTNEFSDIAVAGIPDPQWGSAVAAFYPASDGPRSLDKISQLLVASLASYKIPKHLIPVETWPRNAQGKVDKKRLRAAPLGARASRPPSS